MRLLTIAKPCQPWVGKLSVVGDSGDLLTTSQRNHKRRGQARGLGPYGRDSMGDRGPAVMERHGEAPLQIRRGARTGPTLAVEMGLDGCKVEAVVDTGTEVTLVFKDFFSSVAGKEFEALPHERVKLQNAEDGLAMYTIRVETRLQIGDFEKQWPVFVAPIL